MDWTHLALEPLEARRMLSFTPAAGSPYPLAAAASPEYDAIGDFNNDGRPDIVTANNGNASVTVLFGQADGSFTVGPTTTIGVGSGPFNIAVGFFNPGTNLDIAVTNSAAGTVSILLGDGTGNFTVGGNSPITVGSTPAGIVAGRFDADANIDLAVANSGGASVSILSGHGDGTFTAGAPIALPAASSPQQIVAADFNGDGSLDLATANLAGTVSILMNNGSGAFAVTTTPVIAAGANLIGIAAGDLNSDPFTDLAVGDSVHNSVTVLLGNGAGGASGFSSVGTGSPLAIGSNPTALAIADFNGDLIQDIVAGAGGASNVSVLQGIGNGTFQPVQNTATGGTGPIGVVVGRFDANLSYDLGVSNQTSHNVSSLLNTQTVFAGGVVNVFGDLDSTNQDDQFKIILDPTGTNVQIWVNNNKMLGMPNFSAPKALVSQINVFGLGGNDNLIVDSSNGLISLGNGTTIPNNGIRYDGGTGFDSLALAQTGGATQTTDELGPGATPGSGRSIITGASGVQTVDFTNLEPIIDSVPAVGYILASLPGLASVLDASNAINYTGSELLGFGTVTVDNFEPIQFTSKDELIIDAGAGDDTINLRNSVAPAGSKPGTFLSAIEVNGGDPTASDTLIVNGIFAAADKLIVSPTGTGSGGIVEDSSASATAKANFVPVTFSAIEHLSMVGQTADGDALIESGTAGDDTFEVAPGTAPDAGTVTGFEAGSTGFAFVPIAFSGFNSFVRVNSVQAGSDTLIVDGTSADDTFQFASSDAVFTGFASVHVNGHTGIFGPATTWILRGLDGNDTFNTDFSTVGGSNQPGTLAIQGGDSDQFTDTINYTAPTGAATTIDYGLSKITSTGPVVTPATFTGIEKINEISSGGGSTLTVNGTTGPDSLTYTPTDVTAGTVTLAGASPLINFTGVGGAFTINGGGGVDQLAINATVGSDTVAVIRAATTTTVTVTNPSAVALKSVILPAASATPATFIQTLVVNALNGDDTINVSGPTNNQILTVDGGLPTASDTLTITNTATGTTTVKRGSSPDAGVITTPDGSVAYVGIENISLTAAAAADTLAIQGTNGSDTIAAQVLGGANRVWVNADAVVTFATFSILNLNGLFGDDKFSVSPVGLAGVTTINVAGGDPTASDSLIVNGSGAADTTTITPTGADSGSVAITGSPTVNFTTTESVLYNGLGGNDLVTFALGALAASTTTYTPGVTPDSASLLVTTAATSFVPMAFTNLGVAGVPQVVTINGAAGSNLVYQGTVNNDTFTVTGLAGPNGKVALNNQLPVVTNASITSLTLNGLDGDDIFNVTATPALTFTAAINLNGGNPSASDTVNLTGDGTAVTDNFGAQTVTGGGLGTVNLTGDEIVNLIAAAGAIAVVGTTGPDSVNVTPTTATQAIVMIAGINQVVNTTNTSTLTVDPAAGTDLVTVNGTNANNAITVAPSGANTTVLVNALKMITLPTANTEALKIAGGVANDVLTVDSTTGPVLIPITYDGGAGSNSLTLSGGAALSSTYSVGPQVGSGISSIVFAGGTQTVHFLNLAPVLDLVPASTTTVNATNADNAINYTQGLVNSSNDGLVSIDNQETYEFSNKDHLILNGLAGSDTFNLNNPGNPAGFTAGGLKDIAVNGGDPTASDTLIVNGTPFSSTITFAPTAIDAGSVTVKNVFVTLPITFASIEHVVINGDQSGPGTNDGLIVKTPAGPDQVVLTPGATVDAGSVQVDNLVPMTFQSLGSAGIVTIDDNTPGNRIDSLIYNGTVANDTFNVVGATGAVTLNSRIVVDTPGVANLVLNGLNGDDQFNLFGALPYTSSTVNGGDPSGSDITNLAGATGAVTVNLADSTIPTNTTITGYGGTVTLTGVEVVNMNADDNALTAVGTAQNDTITYTPTGATAGTFTNAGLNTVFNFSTVAGLFTIDPAGGSNAVDVIGTTGDNTINVVGGAVTTTVQVDALKLVNLPTANTQALDVSGLQGNDIFNVTPSLTIPISVDGGDPIGNNPPLAPPNGDQLNIIAGGNSVSFSQGPLADSGSFVVNSDQPVSFIHIERAGVTNGGGPGPIGPVTINGSNEDDDITVTAIDTANQAQFGAAGADGIQDFAVQPSDGPTVFFLNAPTLQVNGLAGDDDIVVQAPAPLNENWNVQVGIDGGAPSAHGGTLGDTVAVETTGTAVQTVTYTPTGVNAGSVGLPTITSSVTLIGVENLTVNGIENNDLFSLIGTALADSIVATPGPTTDSGALRVNNLLGVTYQDLGAAATVTVNGAAGSDTLIVNGTAASDTFNVASTGAVTLNGNLPIQQANVENLALNGFNGDDLFNLQGGLPYTTTTVDGGDPSASDIMTLTGATGAVAVNLADSTLAIPTNTTITGYGGTVTLTGVEVANLDTGGNSLAANGTSQNDTITYTPTGPSAGTFTNAGLNTVFNFTNTTATFTINGGTGSGADQVVVQGTNARDLFQINQGGATPSVSVFQNNVTALKPVILGATIEELTADGLLGQDTFQVIPGQRTPGAASQDNLLINVDGGATSGENNALVIAGSFAGVGGTATALPATSFVVVNRGADANSGTARVFQSAVADPDINYVHVQTVSPLVAGTSLNPNLLVLGPDTYEPNDFQGTAAFLASGSTLPIQHASIFPNSAEFPGVPADQDYYRVVAQTTGTLDFQVYFRLFSPTLLPAGGNLALAALDGAGNVIAATATPATFGTVGATANARLRIPAVAGQSYFLHVFGANAAGVPNGTVVNGYDATIINTAPPVPTNLELSRSVLSATVTSGGAGYTSVPTVTVTGGGGTGATAAAFLGSGATAGQVVTVTITGGSGYTSAPTVTLSGGGATGATAAAVLGSGATAGQVVALTVTSGGVGYTAVPTVTLTGGGGTGATATAVLGSGATAGQVVALTVTNGGTGYTSVPTVTLTGGGSPTTLATVTASLGDAGDLPSNTQLDDTGRSQFDNVTKVNNPTIYLRLDDATLLQDLPGNQTAGGVPPMGAIPIPFNPSTALASTTAGYRIALYDGGDGATGAEPDHKLDPNDPTFIGFAQRVPDPTVAGTFIPHLYALKIGSQGELLPADALSDGLHHITARVQIIDPATPTQTAFGDRSQSLDIVVDTVPPPVFFGNAADPNHNGLDPSSDSGVVGQPTTLTDGITNVTTPKFFGVAEANSIVKLYADLNNNGIVDPTDIFLGQTVAIPLDGTNAYPNGQWNLQSTVDLNNPAFFPHDGIRHLLVTAEDLAGNVSPAAGQVAQQLSIFLDTAGPQITNVQITGHPDFNLFGLKPNNAPQGPTPLVNSLTISVQDLPAEVAGFLRNAIATAPAGGPVTLPNPGIFVVQGDHNGVIPITSVIVTNTPPVAGQPAALATIQLIFAQPLPDDRFTLTIKSEGLVDPAGNDLDGESNAIEPNGAPSFPSGDGQPGGDFVARFTVDSRPEIGTYAAGNVFVDINGNMVWDPQGVNNDYTNRDLNFSLGIGPTSPYVNTFDGMGIHDTVVAGNFPSVDGGKTANGFDKLGAYGFDPLVNGYRWLIDRNGDGVIGAGDTAMVQPAIPGFNINAIPVVGDFDPNLPGVAELGLFNGVQWLLNTTGHSGPLIASDTIVTPGLTGAPIVGHFNGTSSIDLATYKDGVFHFAFGPAFTTGAAITFGLPGNASLPVAADMNQDGTTDIGLFLPGKTGVLPQSSGNWEFLVSNAAGIGLTGINALNHPFEPTPLGSDILAQFGDASALPIVGNFDPPVAAAGMPTPSALSPILASSTVSASVTAAGQWYSFEPLRSGTVSVSSTIATTGANLSINLYDANYNSLGGASATAVGKASLNHTVTAGQTYLVRLTGNDPAATVNFSNSVAEADRCDTNRSGQVNASDLLQIINYLNANGHHATPQVFGDPNLYMDTNLDGQINPQDALAVINYLLAQPTSSSTSSLAESGAAPSASTSSAPEASSAVAIGLTVAANSSLQSANGQSASGVAQAPADVVYSQIGSAGAPASALISDPSAAQGSTTASAEGPTGSLEMAIDASLADPNWDPLG